MNLCSRFDRLVKWCVSLWSFFFVRINKAVHEGCVKIELVLLAKPKSFPLWCCGGQAASNVRRQSWLPWPVGFRSVSSFPPLPDLSVQQRAAPSVLKASHLAVVKPKNCQNKCLWYIFSSLIMSTRTLTQAGSRYWFMKYTLGMIKV